MKSIAAVLGALLIPLAGAWAATLTGRVVGVHDGDSITVLDDSRTQYKIRLSGIDAPELKQAFGTRSKQSLADMVYDKQVTVEREKPDRYGRIVGVVYIVGQVCIRGVSCQESKTDTGLMQVASGMAWHYKQYAREQSPTDRERYATEEKQARDAKRGLWADANPVPPWEWRRNRP